MENIRGVLKSFRNDFFVRESVLFFISKFQITAVTNYFRWITYQHSSRLVKHDNISSGSSFVEHFFFPTYLEFTRGCVCRSSISEIRSSFLRLGYECKPPGLSTDSAMSKINKKPHLLHSVGSFFFLFLQDVDNYSSPKLLLCISNNVYPFTTPPSSCSDTRLHNK